MLAVTTKGEKKLNFMQTLAAREKLLQTGKIKSKTLSFKLFEHVEKYFPLVLPEP